MRAFGSPLIPHPSHHPTFQRVTFNTCNCGNMSQDGAVAHMLLKYAQAASGHSATSVPARIRWKWNSLGKKNTIPLFDNLFLFLKMSWDLAILLHVCPSGRRLPSPPPCVCGEFMQLCVNALQWSYEFKALSQRDQKLQWLSINWYG